MKLTGKNLENLRAVAASPTGLTKSEMPHPRNVQRLVKDDLIEVCGDTWIARATITDKGLRALKETDD